MGAKSTTELTREDAISRAASLTKEFLRRKTEAKYYAMSDRDLEEALNTAGLDRDLADDAGRMEAIKDLGEWDLESQARAIEAEFYAMSDKELEYELERLNDATYGSGHGLDNYAITPNPGQRTW
jgi:ribonucleotide monophosphatase NagD (HAD superfamily)